MFIHQDWLMRQIEMVTMVLARLLFGKTGQKAGWEQALEDQQTRELTDDITGLLRQEKLGEAENLLFARLEGGFPEQAVLTAAVDFYRRANELTDSQLEAQGFTREELWDGLGQILRQCGVQIPGFWEQERP